MLAGPPGSEAVSASPITSAPSAAENAMTADSNPSTNGSTMSAAPTSNSIAPCMWMDIWPLRAMNSKVWGERMCVCELVHAHCGYPARRGQDEARHAAVGAGTVRVPHAGGCGGDG